MSSSRYRFDSSPRTLILCFDGTTNEFNHHSTNLMKLYELFEKGLPNQFCYYQPGVGLGTYSSKAQLFPNAGMRRLQCWLDQAFAVYIDAHILGGYMFIMDNYCPGAKICLFGFSRGAYIARALAGMLHKIGLLPRGNRESIRTAYKLYTQTGPDNYEEVMNFRRHVIEVSVDFVGVWDTVASVGMFARHHLPFASGNSTIRIFRHALALDECRTKFRPSLWWEEESVQPRNQQTSNVLEMWFVGCHSDVGGGSPEAANLIQQSNLSRISLRWMVQQICYAAAHCCILFDPDALKHRNITIYDDISQQESLPGALPDMDMGLTWKEGDLYIPRWHRERQMAEAQLQYAAMRTQLGTFSEVTQSLQSIHPVRPLTAMDKMDALGDLHSQLHAKRVATVFWWILECLCIGHRDFDSGFEPRKSFRPNMGRGREIPDRPVFHWTVEERCNGSTGYKPCAVWAEGTERYDGRPT